MGGKRGQNKSEDSLFWQRQNLIADAPLSLREKWALQVIFLYASHEDDGRCFASNELLQKRLSLGPSQASSLINGLAKKGLIENRKTQSGKCVRTINWKALSIFADPENHKSESPDPENRNCGIPDSQIRNPGVADPDSRSCFNIQNIQGTSLGTSKAKKFVKPSVEEVAKYCAERGNTIDAETFVDYYESKGWLVGKSPMKNWQAAVRNWEKNTQQGSHNAQSKESNRVPAKPGKYGSRPATKIA